MSKVSVIDLAGNVLEPCHPGTARILLKTGKAKVHRKHPFGICLNRVVPCDQIVTTAHTFGYDPGSRYSGVATVERELGEIAVMAEVHHCGHKVKENLNTRRGFRRGRRTRNRRYRAARFNNRSRKVAYTVQKGDALKIKYIKVLNTRKTQTEFNRVSNAMLRDPRYTWERLNRKKPAPPMQTPRYANGRKLRDGDKYLEMDGGLYRYKKKNPAHKGLTPKTYKAKRFTQQKRWKRTVKPAVRASEEKRIQAWREKHKLEIPKDHTNAPWSNGWIPPSLLSRVHNLVTILNRYRKLFPITHLAVENVKFDMQLIENPEIKGEAYQQGVGRRNMRAYLLERTKGRCFLCGCRKGLTIAHLIPDSKGGRFEKGNLSMACRSCQTDMSNIHPLTEPDTLKTAVGEDGYRKIRKEMGTAKKPLKDAAAVNSIRFKIVEVLKATGLPVEYCHGGETAHRRDLLGLPKRHYYDAAVVAGAKKRPTKDTPVHIIKAVGYGHRGKLGGKEYFGKAPGLVRQTAKRPESCGFQVRDEVEFRMKKTGETFRGIIDGFAKTKKGKPRKLTVIPNGFWGKYLKKGQTCPSVFKPDRERNTDISELRLIRRRDGYRYHTVAASRDFRKPKSTQISTKQAKVKPKHVVEDIQVIEQLYLF